MRSATGLAALGLRVWDMHPIAHQRTGVFTLVGTDNSRRRVVVRVYGRDAYDNRLLARLWRAALYRDARPRPSERAVRGLPSVRRS